MSERIDKAIENHKKGYNCCQAVACAFCDLVGMDEETMFRTAEAFGLGMGCMNGTCGALSGAVMLAGLKNSCGDPSHPVSKGATYRLSSSILKEFETMNGATACRDLKGVETGVVLRSCGGCVKDAAVLAEKILNLDEVH